MASRNLQDLLEDVRDNAKLVIEVCREAGVDILIYCTLRPLDEQARLFRQSRSREEIKSKTDQMNARGLHFLAEVIERVGPCYGRHVTNAAPGESWHNYGEAWDAVPLIGGKPAWNYLHAKSHWDAYGECVRLVNMYWAGDWKTFREYPHAQLRQGGNPLKQHSPEEIRDILTSRGLL